MGLTLLTLAAVFSISIIGFNRAQKNVQAVTLEVLPRVVYVTDVRSAYQSMHATVYELAVSDATDRQAEIEGRLTTLRKTVLKGIQDYERQAAHSEDRELARQAKFKLISYLTLIDQVKTLAKSGERDLALEVVSREALPAHKNVAQALDAMVSFNRRKGEVVSKASDSAYQRTLVLTAGSALAGLVIIVLGGYLLGRSVTHPLGRMQKGITHTSERLDFTAGLPEHGPREIATTLQAYNSFLERLRSSISDVKRSVLTIGGVTETIDLRAREIVNNSGVQSGAVLSAAAAMEQMATSMARVTEQAGDASRLAREAEQTAAQSGQTILDAAQAIEQIALAVKMATGRVETLQQESNDISSVVRLIKEISDQTNLLALNAAIEAARAGEHGRGFAVVADEVRKLADRTTQSTMEIDERIQQMQAGAQLAADGMQAVVENVSLEIERSHAVGVAINAIQTRASQAATVVDDISVAMREQTAASSSIAQQMERIAGMTESNSASANASAGAVKQLVDLGRHIMLAVEQYKV
ncbi:MAG: methyl-accepting chemotaxis protein [Pseudogulbenkiania sp.]|nr:methyl-accepting chemotaxis protein [Pseudogulbenkiania sp.]